MDNTNITIDHFQVSKEGFKTVQTNVAIETSVALSVNGENWLTLQCSPTEIDSLAIGFLYNEGFIRSSDEIATVHLCDQKSNIEIWLNHSVEKPDKWYRSSGCFDGVSSNKQNQNPLDLESCKSSLQPDVIFDLLCQFLDDQTPHSKLGGVHTTALADGNILKFKSIDIGRHNSIDKIAGRILLDKISVNKPVLITTGRLSADIVQKSMLLRCPFLVSLRSATQSAITLADQLGITLISRATRTRFNLLSHPERILSV